jgi:hypothetical protein
MIRDSALHLLRTGPAVVALAGATALLGVLALVTPFGETHSPATPASIDAPNRRLLRERVDEI